MTNLYGNIYRIKYFNMQTEIQTLQEEVFCLNYELETLTDNLLRKSAERWVPKFLFPHTEREHIIRYEFVSKLVKDKKVLDIAGGSGYGTYIIANSGLAKEVTSCDLNEKAVRYGNFRYPHQNIKRLVANAETYCNEDYFDLIVSFETIEHLSLYKDFLSNMKKSLKNDGFFIVSTPVVLNTTSQCHNQYHVIEWSYKDFHSLISKYFIIDKVYFQDVKFNNVFSKSELFFNKIKKRLLKTRRIQDISKPLESRIEEGDGVETNSISSGYQIFICKKK